MSTPIHSLYFIENLTLISWFFYVLPQLIRRHSTEGVWKGKVYFIDGSKSGILAARLMSWITRFELERLVFRLRDIRDDSGTLLQLRISYHDLAEVQEKIIATPLFQDVLRSEAVNNRMSTFLIKQSGISGSCDSSNRTIWRAIFLIQLVVWLRKNDRREGAEVVLFIGRRPWMQVIQAYASQYDVQVVQVNRETILHFDTLLSRLKVALPRPVKCTIRGLRTLWYSFSTAPLKRLIKQFMSGRRGTAPANDPRQYFRQAVDSLRKSLPQHLKLSQRSVPKLAVEYYGHLNLNRPDLHSDLFFWQQSQLLGQDILVTFGIAMDQLEETTLSEIMEHGITAVALNPRSAAIPSMPVYTYLPFTGQKESSRQKPRDLRDSFETRFLIQQISSYYESYDYWTDFFERYNIKIYVSWYKYDATHCVISDALQSVGGITTIYQRAFEEFPSPETTIAADLVFGFSPEGADIERDSKSVIPYYVITGYMGDHRFPLVRKHAQAIRNKLCQRGASRVLAFFDENSADDSRWHLGHEFVREDYRFLLEKVLSEPWLGLVLKPKVPSTLRRRLNDVADLLERAEKTGRCVVLEEGIMIGAYPPSAAALASDVAIHGYLNAATAGIEAALAGVPTLLLDRAGWPGSKLYGLGRGRVVFTDWQDVWNTCLEHWDTPQGVSGFGDWSSMLNELDPFRDGRAAERMGTYLKWLLDGLKSGTSRDLVMADVAERYCKAWGQDKVVEIR